MSEGLIRILPPEEARNIAAGEVVDRPAALVREFLDNAIDAGATLIEIAITGGGSKCIEIRDNGTGMEKEDLELCYLDHATSKIRSMADLGRARTLGFRGEALSAATAVSRLSIVSSTDGSHAWKLNVGSGVPVSIEQTSRSQGTTVTAAGIFDDIPARKRFLKRDGTEASVCKNAFLEKALAFPSISFRFFQDNALKMFLPVHRSLKERFASIEVEAMQTNFLHEIAAAGEHFQLRIVIGGSEIAMATRRKQYIFANGRRIDDPALMQALEYGVQGWFPNNTHPVGAVYLNVDPEYADFNIHPAKREARFVDSAAIHHTVTESLRALIHPYLARPEQIPVIKGFDEYEILKAIPAIVQNPAALAERALQKAIPKDPDFTLVTRNNLETLEVKEPKAHYDMQYRGHIFGLFFLIEQDDRLFIIDQHAAHERILYDEFLSKAIPRQELLVALPFETGSAEDDAFLKKHQPDFERLGIVIVPAGGAWRIESLPEQWRKSDHETIQAILDLKNAPENMAERWAATLACHRAVKDGDRIGEGFALSLAKSVLSMPDPRCPHGRPLWFELTKDALCKLVQRQ
ncbi:DNA mismatch repair protein MutL [Spirochaetia bacterium]|nr:DNA mismatch repair protein MutL [Spirochaetia bacterium]